MMSVSALNGILRRKGYEVLIAPTLQQAFSCLAQQPDYVLLDLMLPDGDGSQLLEHIRNQRLPIKVIVITAVNDTAHLQRVRDLQPTQLMKKPIDLTSLLRVFELKN